MWGNPEVGGGEKLLVSYLHGEQRGGSEERHWLRMRSCYWVASSELSRVAASVISYLVLVSKRLSIAYLHESMGTSGIKLLDRIGSRLTSRMRSGYWVASSELSSVAASEKLIGKKSGKHYQRTNIIAGYFTKQ